MDSPPQRHPEHEAPVHMTVTAFVPKGQRTPTAWRRACLEILQAEVHAKYGCNQNVGGRYIELSRRDENGLHLSYNFVRIREEYHLCFGVLFSLEQTSELVTPFLAGSRFDHNRTIWRLLGEDFALCRQDVDYPSGVWSHSLWRDNTLNLLIEGLKVPEQCLYPRYLDALRTGKNRLAAIFARGAELCATFADDELDDHAHVNRRVTELGLSLAQLDLLKSVQLRDAFRLAGGALAPRYGSADVDLRQVPIDGIILANLASFYRERANLVDYAKIALAL